ncbi:MULTISPECIES: hypothetical protein, partial [unclassified Sphingomonas]|uniref:hypothetical protein n=1 Tax=unclassified Sphingomonas TaxID=196159 RepID=UPI001E5F0FED
SLPAVLTNWLGFVKYVIAFVKAFIPGQRLKNARIDGMSPDFAPHRFSPAEPDRKRAQRDDSRR